MTKLKYDIITGISYSSLIRNVQEKINDGWKPIGGHQVAQKHIQNRYAGSQHRDSIIELEYSQAMTKLEEINLADKLNNVGGGTH